MNYLAHAFLAAPDPARMCGAIVGDFAKGLDVNALPVEIAAGVRGHRRVDRFTDDHAVVRRARERFEPRLRRFAGIALDVAFDHFLAKHFTRFGTGDLPTFSRTVYAALAAHDVYLPERLRSVRPRMAAEDWLFSYVELDNVRRALIGISRRMRHENPLVESFSSVVSAYADLESDFLEFFPELQRFEAASLEDEASGAISW